MFAFWARDSSVVCPDSLLHLTAKNCDMLHDVIPQEPVAVVALSSNGVRSATAGGLAEAQVLCRNSSRDLHMHAVEFHCSSACMAALGACLRAFMQGIFMRSRVCACVFNGLMRFCDDMQVMGHASQYSFHGLDVVLYMQDETRYMLTVQDKLTVMRVAAV
jgi:hypothetical protein